MAIACKDEIEEYRNIFFSGIDELNELSYHGFSENLDRVEKDGLKADLMKNVETYFGTVRDPIVARVQEAYTNMIETVENKGFGLSGLIFNQEYTKRELAASYAEH